MTVQRSVVKWFDAKKGYGFIVHPDGGDDIFVHYTQIDSDKDFKTLRTGQVVEFELHEGPKGPHGNEVSVIDTERDETSPDEDEQAAPEPTDTSAAVDSTDPQSGYSEATSSAPESDYAEMSVSSDPSPQNPAADDQEAPRSP